MLNKCSNQRKEDGAFARIIEFALNHPAKTPSR